MYRTQHIRRVLTFKHRSTRTSSSSSSSFSFSFSFSTSPSWSKMSSPSKFSYLPLSTRGPIECAVSGTVLLNTPYFNRGSAHTIQEREEFNLTGLLPHSVQTLEQQAKRAYEQYSTRSDDLAKNTFLTSLKEQNAVLYFRVSNLPRPVSMFGSICFKSTPTCVMNKQRFDVCGY